MKSILSGNPPYRDKNNDGGNFPAELNANQRVDNMFAILPLDCQGKTESSIKVNFTEIYDNSALDPCERNGKNDNPSPIC